MIVLFCFYLLLAALSIVYFYYHKTQFTKEILIALALKIGLITMLYFLFFSPAQKIVIDNAALNNLFK